MGQKCGMDSVLPHSPCLGLGCYSGEYKSDQNLSMDVNSDHFILEFCCCTGVEMSVLKCWPHGDFLWQTSHCPISVFHFRKHVKSAHQMQAVFKNKEILAESDHISISISISYSHNYRIWGFSNLTTNVVPHGCSLSGICKKMSAPEEKFRNACAGAYTDTLIIDKVTFQTLH